MAVQCQILYFSARKPMLIEDYTTWNRIRGEGRGYIYNDFGTQFPGNAPTWNTTDFNKLHGCDCWMVQARGRKEMTHETDRKLTKHFFETLEGAITWLQENRSE